eukprot:311791-Prorocentrum_minimum.AAC.1
MGGGARRRTRTASRRRPPTPPALLVPATAHFRHRGGQFSASRGSVWGSEGAQRGVQMSECPNGLRSAGNPNRILSESAKRAFDRALRQPRPDYCNSSPRNVDRFG